MNLTAEQKLQFMIALAKSGANISQVNLGDGTQNFYIGGKEQEHPVVAPAEIVDVVDEDSATPDELSSSRQEILEQLLHYVTKGNWIAPATVAGIQDYLRTVLNAGEKRLTGDDARMSADLWKMLEQGRGDRVKVVMQNLIGYFVSRKWLQRGSPALNKAFFGKEDGYSNIDKGNPRGSDMSQGFRNVLPLLEKTDPLNPPA